MAKVKINTEVAKNCGQAIKEQAEKFNTNLDKMYESINNLPNTNAWIGTPNDSSVYKFIDIVSKEKEQYVKYAKFIYDLGNIIEDLGSSLDNAIDSINLK